RRAVQIGKVIDLKEIKAATLAEALDGIAAGMWLLDANARIVHTNAAGQAMLLEGRAIHASNGKLMLRDLSAERALQEMLVNLGASEHTIGERGFSMRVLGQEGGEYAPKPLPLPPGARRSAPTHSAVAAVFIRAARFLPPHPLETIARLYKLTPAEL